MKKIESHTIRKEDFSKEYLSTAGGLLVDRGRVLLEKRPDDKSLSPGAWDTPGGKVRKGETPESALERELLEELGIKVMSLKLHAVYAETVSREISKAGFVRHFEYLVEEWEGEAFPRENQHLEWRPLEEASKLIPWL